MDTFSAVAAPARTQQRTPASIAATLASAARVMADGLSDTRHSPERALSATLDAEYAASCPVFDVHGVKLLVAPVHHAAAHAALAKRARAVRDGGRVFGLLTASGNRSDDELLACARAYSESCDELIVFESDHRGRLAGETSGLLAAGALGGMNPGRRVHNRADAAAALVHALSMAQRGDVLAVACGASLQALVQALRTLDAQAAYRVAIAAGF